MGGLQYTAIIIPLLLLAVGLEFFVSKRKKVQTYTLSDTIINMCCGMLERLFDFFWVVGLFFVFQFLFENVALWKIPLNPFTWIIALFVGDFLAYWHHRLSHEINFLWASHIVHHQSEELNLTTVFRVSFFAVINRSFFWIWMPIAGFDPATTTSVLLFIGLFQFVTHTRLVGKLGWLEYLFVTPSHHRVHHARNEKYMDRNYGHVFIIWDKMFGTFTKEEEEPEYGITSGFNSSNPYRAMFFYWIDLFTRAGRAKKIGDKIMVFLRGPRWTPKDVGFLPHEYQTNEKGERTTYRLPVTRSLGFYIFLNALITTGMFASLFAIKKSIEDPTILQLVTNPTILALGGMVLYSIWCHAWVLEGRKGAILMDIARIVLVTVTLPFLLAGLVEGIYVAAGFAAVGFIMLIWLIRLKNTIIGRRKEGTSGSVRLKAA